MRLYIKYFRVFLLNFSGSLGGLLLSKYLTDDIFFISISCGVTYAITLYFLQFFKRRQFGIGVFFLITVCSLFCIEGVYALQSILSDVSATLFGQICFLITYPILILAILSIMVFEFKDSIVVRKRMVRILPFLITAHLVIIYCGYLLDAINTSMTCLGMLNIFYSHYLFPPAEVNNNKSN